MTDIVQQQERLDSLRERANELQATDHLLFTKIKDARVAGEDPRELRTERLKIKLELEELDAVVPQLAAEIEAAEKDALHVQAEGRVREIHRSISGHSGEQQARMRRLVKASEAYRKEATAVNGAFISQRDLLAEESALRQRFDGLPETNPRTMQLPGKEPMVEQAVATVQAVTFPVVPSHLPRPSMPEDSPAAKLIEAAGPTEAELSERTEKKQEREKREEEESRIAANPLVQRELERAATTPSGFRV